jgi:hypothetical protein
MELPKLLLSPTHLVDLRLSNIPHSGYISSEAMVTYLSALASREEISPEFQSPHLTVIERAGVCLLQHALSFPLSHLFGSRVSTNIWTTLWPGSIPLDSITFI